MQCFVSVSESSDPKVAEVGVAGKDLRAEAEAHEWKKVKYEELKSWRLDVVALQASRSAEHIRHLA